MTQPAWLLQRLKLPEAAICYNSRNYWILFVFLKHKSDENYLYKVLPDFHIPGGSLQDEGGLVNATPSLYSLPRVSAAILTASWIWDSMFSSPFGLTVRRPNNYQENHWELFNTRHTRMSNHSNQNLSINSKSLQILPFIAKFEW